MFEADQGQRVIDEYAELLRTLMAAPLVPFQHEPLRTRTPKSPGVYRVFRQTDQYEELTLIYIGKSGNLNDRLLGKHLSGAPSASTFKRKIMLELELNPQERNHYSIIREYISKHCHLQWIEIADERRRTFFEHYAIAVCRPPLND
jgi:hypothetical protein